MCGICGIIGKRQDVDRSRLDRMLKRMAHRGPDGFGVWADEEVAFGHGRLAIIDVSDAGAQPMHHSQGLHCVVNGEIYNYPELRKELEEQHNVVFSSDCDSEIVLHGYLAQGVSFFERLNGMFAFALCDVRKKIVHLVRDRIGIKPLYYTSYNGQLIFASEIKGLFGAIDAKSWTIDPLGLSQYMTYQTGLGDRTLFQDVRLLLPGHILTIELNRVADTRIEPFWTSRQKEDNSISFHDAVDQYKQVFASSVERHLLSDVPVATYISAGFDSSCVSVQAAHLSKQGLNAYTGWFDIEGGWYDETIIAGEAVDRFNGQHKRVSINDADFVSELDNVVDALDEPKMGMGAFSQFMVAKAAAQDFKVILTGHGGDELFSGYPVFKLAQGRGLQAVKPSEIPHLAYFALSNMRSKISPEFGRHMPVLWSMNDQQSLLRYDVRGLKPWQALQQMQDQHERPIDKVFQTYLNAYLPSLLVVEDKISMAHKLESRTPMLDNNMIDLSLRVPQSIKLHGHELKAIIKAGARDLLPESFFSQSKRGFPTPLRLWLRGNLKGILEERILGGNSRLSRLFDNDVLRRIIGNYARSPRRFIRPLDEIQSHRMWQLLCLEAWLRIWEEKYDLTLRMP